MIPARKSWVWLALLLLAVVRVQFAPASDGAPVETARPQTSSPPASQAASPPLLTGRILSAETGAPLAGARIDLLAWLEPEEARARRAARDIPGAPIAHAIADASGRFRIEAPAHARVIVAAQARGHARVRLSRVFETGAPGDDRDLGAIELPAGRPLSGKVVDPAGKPVANAAVLVMPPSRREASAGPAGALLGLAAGSRDAMLPESTTTGPDGSFRFDAAPVAPVTVRVHAGGWAPAAVRIARPAALAPIRLEPGREITGKVLAPDGKSPVEGAWVMAGDQGLDGMSRSRADGSFRLERVPFAETSLKATVSTASALPEASAGAPGARASWAASLPARLKAAETDGGSSPIVLKLRQGGIVRARILDGETRAPVSGAFVMLTHADPDEASRCVTGASGEVLFTGVPAGAAGLFGQAEGYLDLRLRERPVAHEGETRLTAALQPASSLEGMVKDGVGRPIAGAKLTVSGPSPIALPIGRPLFVPLPIDPVETGAEGRFVIESLPARTELKLDIEAPGFAPAQESGISLRAGERRRGVEIRMDSGGTLSGRLIEPGGKPVAAAAVVATRSQENADGGVVIRVGSGGSWSGGGAGARRRGAGGIRAGLGEAESLPRVAPDAEGVFRVRGVRPGIWSLKITAPGRAPRIVAGLKIESTSGFDAGDLVLEPGALIRGRVTGPSGEPVPYARGLVRRQFDMLGEFTTAEDGSFTTEDLVPAEPVTLSVDADGYGPAEKNALVPPIDDLVVTLAASSRVRGQVLDRETRRPVTDFGIRIGRGYGAGLMLMMSGMRQASRFTSEDGTFTLEDVDPGRASLTASAAGLRDSTLNDIEIPEGADLEGLVFLMDRAAAVSGTVVDDRARPVAGVQVRRKETSGRGFQIRLPEGDSTTTDGDGAFHLDGLAPEPLTLVFSHNDYENAEVDVDASREVSGLKISLSRGGSLVGIVLREDTGAPVAGANVSASAAGDSRMSSGRSATTSPDGSFVLEALPAGRYAVRASAAGLKAAELADVVVAAGAAPPPLELRLGGGVTLTGTVTGIRPEEAGQLSVRAFASGPGSGVTAPVDASGAFVMKGLESGAVTLVAGSAILGGRSVSSTIQIPDGASTFETTIEFPAGYSVEGTVTRAGLPIDGAQVLFFNSASRASVSATTDASGAYRAEGLDDGEHDVTVLNLSAGITHRTKTPVSSDRRFDIELPLARVSGTVIDAESGRPLEGATVQLEAPSGATANAGRVFVVGRSGDTTDATGRFTIEGVSDGNYTLIARKDGYAHETRPVAIAPSLEPAELDITLNRSDALRLLVTDAASGLPVRSLSALVISGGAGDPLSPGGTGALTAYRGVLSTDASGAMSLDSLQPGVYRIVLGGAGLGWQTVQDVRVPGPELALAMSRGGRLEVELTGAPAGRTARGCLLDALGKPVHVNGFSPEPAVWIRAGTPEVLQEIAPGIYRLRVQIPGGGIAEKEVEIAPGSTTRVRIP